MRFEKGRGESCSTCIITRQSKNEKVQRYLAKKSVIQLRQREEEEIAQGKRDYGTNDRVEEI